MWRALSMSYLGFRKQVELAMRAAFIQKGGRPAEQHPIYLVLGSPSWMETVSDPKTLETTEIIRVSCPR
jgi:hypothetical protein